MGTPVQNFGLTLGYNDTSDATYCLHCYVPDGEYCPIEGANPECVGLALPGVDGNVLSIATLRPLPGDLEATFDLVGGNPCEDDPPAIDGHFTIYFRQRCLGAVLGPVEFRVVGTHDGFPWHELLLNGYLVYAHDPCCTRDTPWSLSGGEGEYAFGYNDPARTCDDPATGTPVDQWQEVPGLSP